jgi:hypothetical protein
VRPADFLDLLSKLKEGELEPNVIDLLILEPLLHPTGNSRNLPDTPEISEMLELSRRAFSDDTGSKQEAQAALFALRQTVASDEAGDREDGIRQSEAVLQHIDPVCFPATAGGAHLKIGAALAAQSQSHGVDVDTLRRGAAHLESALSLLPSQAAAMRAMADYNAALAFNTLWQSADDWDSDNDARDKALHHGLAAIDAMNHGASVGSRDWLSRTVLGILMADGAPRDARVRNQVIEVLQAWLASPEGKALPPDEQSVLTEYYHKFVDQRDRA